MCHQDPEYRRAKKCCGSFLFESYELFSVYQNLKSLCLSALENLSLSKSHESTIIILSLMMMELNKAQIIS